MKELILKQSLNLEKRAWHIWKFGQLLVCYTTVKLVLQDKKNANICGKFILKLSIQIVILCSKKPKTVSTEEHGKNNFECTHSWWQQKQIILRRFLFTLSVIYISDLFALQKKMGVWMMLGRRSSRIELK